MQNHFYQLCSQTGRFLRKKGVGNPRQGPRLIRTWVEASGLGNLAGKSPSFSPAHPFTQQARHLQTITVVNKTSDFGQCALQHVCMMVKIQAWVIFTRRRKGQLLIDPCLGSSAQNVLKNMCQNMCLNADKRGGQILFGQCQNKHDFPQVAPQSSLKSRPPGPILLLLAPAHTGSYTLLLGVQRIIVQH